MAMGPSPSFTILCLISLLIVLCAAASKFEDPNATNYILVSARSVDGSIDANQAVRARCISRNRCFLHTLTCPRQCPSRISTSPGPSSCFIDCSKCETSCKRRKPNCYGFGAVCYDPRFVGGDGVMFYFHGKAQEDFCLVSDPNIHVNAHFVGNRPEGRSRDFTWVQAVGIMFNDHKFSVGAKQVSSWDDGVDQLLISYDGEELTVPQKDASIWTSAEEEVRVERLADVNSIQVTINRIMILSVNVVPVTQHDNKVHNYQLPQNDCFAHLELQFKFFKLSPVVEGVLGQTYRPDFKNPVKAGLSMPLMGGEGNYRVSSLFGTDCKACKLASPWQAAESVVQTVVVQEANCGSGGGNGGLVCKR